MDSKLKYIYIITILLVVSVINQAKGQEYSLRSLNGDGAQFQLSKNDRENILSIIYSNDTVYVRDVEDIKIAKILNNNFLLIDYQVRAGTGMNVTKTLILAGSKNKISQSLSITSFFHEDFLDFNRQATSPMNVEVKSLDTVDLALIGDNIENYKLRAKIHEERRSTHAPKSNYKTDAFTTLIFDKTQNIFFNSHEHISGYYTIWDPKKQEESRQYIKGTFPVTKLGNDKYYYINHTWYKRSDKNYLTKYTYN